GSYTVGGDVLVNDSAFDGPVKFAGWNGSTSGSYGSFTANADGTYSYTLNNSHPAVNALNKGQTLTETFSYTVQDADGDTRTASVTITIQGHTDGPPTVSVPDANGAEAGQLSVAENATTAATGHFSIHSEAGVASISVGGTSVSLAQLSGLGSPGASPVTVSTAKGDLTLTGYNAATG
ncbi:MAG: VCBS domain-containing protein, partial [Pseudomonas sp.]